MANQPKQQPTKVSRFFFRSAAILGISVAAVGLLSTLLIALALHDTEQHDQRSVFETSTALLSSQLTSEVQRYVDATQSLAASLGAHDSLRYDDFNSVTAPLQAEQLNGIESVAFVVATDDSGVASTQRYWRSQGNTALSLRPLGDAGTHYFPVFTRSLRSDIVGTSTVVDLANYPEVVSALEASRRSDQVTISRGLASHKDNPMFAQDLQPAFVFVAPAYGPIAGETDIDAESPRPFKGWVAVGLRAQDIASRAFAKSDVRNFDNARVTGLLADGRQVEVSALRTSRPANAMVARRSIVVAQDLWTLEVVTSRSAPFFDGTRPLLSGLVLACGTIGSVLIGVLVYVLAGSRTRALELVAARTSDLQRDIERREQVERDLKATQSESESQKADLSAFAGFAAHDLKAPLTLISGYLDLIRSGIHDPDSVKDGELRQFCERAQRAGKRMRSLVDSLLAFARAREAILAPEAVDLQAALRTVIDELTEQVRTEGEEEALPNISLYPPFPSVYVDAEMMHQVLENLIGNAFKYVAPGTRANIEISTTTVAGQFVELIVADHGIGIPLDRREAIFAGFVRAQNTEGYAGSGLGLAICKRIVERHGGTIRVEDNPGGGARFVVRLPDSPATSTAVDR